MFLIAMHSLVAYAGITGKLSFGDTLINGFGFFSLVNAVVMMLSPKQAMESGWGVKLKTKFQEDAVRGALAFSILAHAACVCMPAFFGADAIKATGWSYLVWFVFALKEFILPNNIPTRSNVLPWVILDAVAAYVTLVE